MPNVNVLNVPPGSKKLSATPFTVTTNTALQQISDFYGIPVGAINNVNSGYEFNLQGTIAQGGTVQTVTFNSQAGFGQNNQFPVLTIPVGGFAISTTYVFWLRIRWICTGFNAGWIDQRLEWAPLSAAVNQVPAIMMNSVVWNLNLQGNAGNGNNQDSLGQSYPIQPLMPSVTLGAVGPTVTSRLSSCEVIGTGVF